jgi:hypothetical protein
MRHKYLVKELTPENIAGAYTKNGVVKTEEFDPDFLGDVIDEYSRRTQTIIKWLFIKRILTNLRLLIYCINAILTQPPSQWGSAYYKVIFFHHVLLWDLRHLHQEA